jgi:8-oxo-dGTP diphosphatase
VIIPKWAISLLLSKPNKGFDILVHMQQNRPMVGVGLLLIRDNMILLGRRRGVLGTHEYGGIGGHLENMESFEDCILRELQEEAGLNLKVQDLRYLCLTNLTKYAPKHYVDIGMVATWKSGEAIVMEPDKLESWHWFDMDSELPSPLFACLANYIIAYRTGQTYFSEV